MDGAAFLAFLGVSVIVIITPGPDTAITIRNTLLGGPAGWHRDWARRRARTDHLDTRG